MKSILVLLLLVFQVCPLKHKKQLVIRVNSIPKEIETDLLESKIKYYMNYYLTN